VYCVVLYYTVLYCIVLCCIVLYCTVSYCTVLHCIVLLSYCVYCTEIVYYQARKINIYVMCHVHSNTWHVCHTFILTIIHRHVMMQSQQSKNHVPNLMDDYKHKETFNTPKHKQHSSKKPERLQVLFIVCWFFFCYCDCILLVIALLLFVLFVIALLFCVVISYR